MKGLWSRLRVPGKYVPGSDLNAPTNQPAVTAAKWKTWLEDEGLRFEPSPGNAIPPPWLVPPGGCLTILPARIRLIPALAACTVAALVLAAAPASAGPVVPIVGDPDCVIHVIRAHIV